VTLPGPASAVVAAAIRRHGPIPFDRYLALALYDEGAGFYEAGGAAGRSGGDFLTSPEVGPLYGAVLARALDTWWDELGRPDPYLVVDAGAGPGTLALAVRAAAPRCAPALRYVLVERSAAQRARHGRHLALSHPETSRSGPGPEFVSLSDVPVGPFRGVVLANELLDNLPFLLVERRGGRWSSIHVGLAADGVGLVEVPVPADAATTALVRRIAPDVPDGARVPVQSEAVAWVRRSLGRLVEGRLVVIDYADSTPGLARRGTEWLRTYRAHERGLDPLAEPGGQDITSEVAVDQLARVRPPDADRSQADFLGAHGIGELVDEGRRIWSERAHLGDLEAIRARSRVVESEALVDPAGLGAFRVLEWIVRR
jgi:SAM-dependent MidA family methyltransferase